VDGCDEYEPGDNVAEAVVGKELSRLLSSAVVDATDVTGWDRGVPEVLLRLFFRAYMPLVLPDVPEHVWVYFWDECVNTKMALPCGSLVEKDHGMPSGWPNTIRANSVINRILSYVLTMMRAEELHLELDLEELDDNVYAKFCGDDSKRIIGPGWEWVCDDGFYAVAARAFPKWVIKREGTAYRRDFVRYEDYLVACPPYVSRKYVPMDGLIWRAPFDLVRTMAQWLHQPHDETVELREARRQGTEVSLMHVLNWHRRGKLGSEYLDRYVANFRPDYDLIDSLYHAQYLVGRFQMTGDEDAAHWVQSTIVEHQRQWLREQLHL